MATLDYIDIPVGATRLRGKSDAHPHNSGKKTSVGSDIRPAPKILTTLPNPSPPPSPTSSKRRLSILSNSLSSPAISLIPQLLLSSTLPPSSADSSSSSNAMNSGLTSQDLCNNTALMSSRDPLSIPIMTTNFKRFVTIIGPVFWLQDRIEEIILWKRGWRRTAVWMASYAFLCS